MHFPWYDWAKAYGILGMLVTLGYGLLLVFEPEGIFSYVLGMLIGSIVMRRLDALPDDPG